MLDSMLDPKVIDDLSRKLAKNLPGGLATLQEDFQRNAAASLQAALARLDLVTREEFDVQQAVLARTREKLQALEQQVAALEAAAREPDDS
jgi:BMFP domain-containing protein YqiC